MEAGHPYTLPLSALLMDALGTKKPENHHSTRTFHILELYNSRIAHITVE